MILKLEAEENCFDGLLVEVSSELRQNPSNFVRSVKETQASATQQIRVFKAGRGTSAVFFG
jgi:hypothetical protein